MNFNPLGSPYSASPITPSNTVDLSFPVEGLYVGTGGDVRLLTYNDDTVVFKNVPNGTYLLQKIKRVFVTGTTATDMLGLL